MRVDGWLANACAKLEIEDEDRATLRGVVFEVRQGYKSNDSKRRQADIANAAQAYKRRYLPILLLMSTQIDRSVERSFVRAQWLILTGTTIGDATESGYTFCRDVVGYDLAGFFQRKSDAIKAELDAVLHGLLEEQ